MGARSKGPARDGLTSRMKGRGKRERREEKGKVKKSLCSRTFWKAIFCSVACAAIVCLCASQQGKQGSKEGSKSANAAFFSFLIEKHECLTRHLAFSPLHLSGFPVSQTLWKAHNMLASA